MTDESEFDPRRKRTTGKFEFLGPREPTAQEREQLDKAGYEPGVVLVEWRSTETPDWTAFVPFPPDLVKTNLDQIIEESLPRIERAFQDSQKE